MNLYRIEHDVTKEVHEGTAKDLGKIIGVTPGTICKKALEYGFIANHWIAKKIAENVPRMKAVEQEKCMYCGNVIPAGKNSYFCNTKCGNKYRQREYNELLKEEYKIRIGKTKERAKPKYSIAEIDAMAKAAGMNYGQYVAVNGL